MDPGQQIDIWKVDHALGSGGMGSVYRCHNADAERILAAIKVLDPKLADSPDAKARFIREAEILFRLQHPNIVRVRNVRMDCNPPYLEMDFVVGTSLEDRLAKEGALPLPEAMALMEELADALVYLHGQQVRHRDIKPANLLIDESGHLKLVDFGLAVEADAARITRAGMTFGTLAYVPPEWLDPDHLDPVQWDLYAMGVVCFEMITGEQAFRMSGEGSSRKQLMQIMMRKQSEPPLDIGERYPHALRSLIQDLTRVEPVDRPQSAAEVQERLGEARRALDAVGWELDRKGQVPTVPAAGPRTSREPQPTISPTATQPAAGPVTAPPRVAGPSPWIPALGLGAAVLVAALWMAWPLGPRTPVEIAVEELPADLPVDLVLAGRRPSSGSEGRFRFRVPAGPTELLWAAGEGCQAVACATGKHCGEWCGHGQRAIEIPRSEVLVTESLSIAPPTPNVRFELPRLKEARKGLFRRQAWPIRLHLGERPGGAKEGWWVGLLDVLPGVYTLEVVVGSCAEEDIGCWPGRPCPPGCASMVEEEVVIPWEEAPILRELQLPPPLEGG